MIRKIRDFIGRRKMESIRNEYLQQIQKNPQDTRSRLKLGDLHAKSGQIPEATEQYMACAEIFAQAGFQLKSIALYKQILKLQPDSMQALRRIAQLSLQYGLYADAFPYYQTLVESLRSQGAGERLFALYEEMSNLPIRDLRQKALVLDALLPEPQGAFVEPYDRLCRIARDMVGEPRLAGDARVLCEWLVAAYPDQCEAREIHVSLLHRCAGRAEFERSLGKLEQFYRDTRQLEAKMPFLQQFAEGEAPVALTPGALDEKSAQKGRPNPNQVKVKMEADIYELMRKKSEAHPDHGADADTPAGLGSHQGPPAERLEFQDLFSTFKEGIREQVGRGDHETHYNLGIAYQEMGLYDEAIQELELACGDPAMRPDAHFLMGRCSAESQRWEEALAYYQKALDAENLELEKSRGIRYELGMALRAVGRDADALRTFQQIREEADHYRDTDRQIEEILQASGA
ncbi:MAG: tetratricopeptide repeat protein [bacterium]